MTTQRRNFQRTPRRRKAIVVYGGSITLGTGTSSPKVEDMLGTAKSELGVSHMLGVTVMDVRGSIGLARFTADGTGAHGTVQVGYTWLDPRVASAGDGDAQIPLPLDLGLRDTRWIQQWELQGQEPPTGSPAGLPLLPVDTSTKLDIHVRNMMKAPTAASQLSLVVAGGTTFGTNTTFLDVRLQIMLALP